MDETDTNFEELLRTKEKLEGQVSSQKALLHSLIESGFSFDVTDREEDTNDEDDQYSNQIHFHQVCLEAENENLKLMINKLDDEMEKLQVLASSREESQVNVSNVVSSTISLELMEDSCKGM